MHYICNKYCIIFSTNIALYLQQKLHLICNKYCIIFGTKNAFNLQQILHRPHEAILEILLSIYLYDRLLVSFRSSLILGIIYKYTKHYKYLQTYLHTSKLLKTHMNWQKLKMPSSLKLGLNIKLFIPLGLIKIMFTCHWHFSNFFSLAQNRVTRCFCEKNCPKTMKNHPKSHPTIFLLDLLYKTVLWCFCLILC